MGEVTEPRATASVKAAAPWCIWTLLSVGPCFALVAPQPVSTTNAQGALTLLQPRQHSPSQEDSSAGAVLRSGCSGSREGGLFILPNPALEAQTSSHKALSHHCLSHRFPGASLTMTDGLVAKIFQFEKSILVSGIILL